MSWKAHAAMIFWNAHIMSWRARAARICFWDAHIRRWKAHAAMICCGMSRKVHAVMTVCWK